MKKLLVILLVAAGSLALLGGCTASEDTSVKEAPADVETKTAAEMGGGRVKAGEGGGGGGGERESRAGG
jgi:hypothetical protein